MQNTERNVVLKNSQFFDSAVVTMLDCRMLSSTEVYKSTEHFIITHGGHENKHKVTPHFRFLKGKETGLKRRLSDTVKGNRSIDQHDTKPGDSVSLQNKSRSSSKTSFNQWKMRSCFQCFPQVVVFFSPKYWQRNQKKLKAGNLKDNTVFFSLEISCKIVRIINSLLCT